MPHTIAIEVVDYGGVGVEAGHGEYEKGDQEQIGWGVLLF